MINVKIVVLDTCFIVRTDGSGIIVTDKLLKPGRAVF